jgi:hypothetical protein
MILLPAVVVSICLLVALDQRVSTAIAVKQHHRVFPNTPAYLYTLLRAYKGQQPVHLGSHHMNS